MDSGVKSKHDGQARHSLASLVLAWGFAWLFTAVCWTGGTFLSLLTLRRRADVIMPRTARFWGTLTLRLLGIKLVMHHGERLDGYRSRVIIANHRSALDLVWAATVAPPGAFAVAKQSFRWIPFFNIGLWVSRSIFIDRRNRERAVAALQGVARRIREEHASLFIAPEGTRSKTGEMLPFKKGAFHLAVEARAPIYAVVCAGAEELLPKGRFVPAAGVLVAECLPPIDVADWNEEELEERIEDVRQKMIEAENRLRQERAALMKMPED
ncbi:MAG: 1-acyl-sn-glycerol-3-phosphate acyltransferase [Bdellovibrionales bacterium]|nr:1-acyl-sn-glycerol-3-phosphate acyltransferase [Bdellovibrionales bacterium]